VSDATPDSPSPPERHRLRNPAAIAAAALAAGIVADRHLPAVWTVSLLLSAAALLVWIVAIRRGWIWCSAVAMLLLLAGVGAARHHQYRSVAAGDDVSRFARTEAVPVVLVGRAVRSPVVIPKKDDVLHAAWPQPDRTFALLDCESLRTGRGEETVSGRVRLQVAGHLPHVEAADRVEVRGWLSQPAGPRNPGEHDFPDRLQREGVRCIVYAGHPDAVRRLWRPAFSVRRAIGGLRVRAEELLERNLRGRELAVASAILLGNRTFLDADLRDAFVQSGMMHLLAISGLHVGILAMCVWLTARALGLPVAATTAVVLSVVVGYAVITEVRPSIVRATVMIAVVCIGEAAHRRVSGLNALSVAALLILLWNPTDLFDVGAQLSFLSVLGMIAAGVWKSDRDAAPAAPQPLPRFGIAGRVLRRGGHWLFRMVATMAAIWLFTLPLVMARFHIVSPIGLAVNIVLIPFIAIVLGCGYLLLFAGLLFPFTEPLIALLFDGSLSLLLGVVDRGATVRLGHFYAPGPPEWWLVIYYGLLAAAAVPLVGRRYRGWGWCGVCAWIIAGLSLGLSPPRQHGLRCTFLAMGHGVGVLIETPDGRTLLYDGGTIGNAERATRTVQSALWERGRPRIDAVVVSHADLDHLNGVPGVMNTVPVGTMFVSRPFLDFRQKPVEAVCETARRRHVPIRIVRDGDRLRLDSQVTVRVLHAPWDSLETDNANSIVLEIEYAGRRILLTGDLEKGGLQRLLTMKKRPVDVMLSPHHGSPAANPAELADWARPRYVVISGGRRAKVDELRRTYAKSRRVFSTYHDGAVMVEISPDGEINVAGFADRK
jgi:competence protein ComEC